MSAIPNLPEDVKNVPVNGHKAALEHVEYANAASNGQDDDAHGIDSAPWILEDHPVENLRPIRVIVIGAGFSGIYCAIRIPEKLRNCELVCYDKNAGVGGTWFENRYPGVACDVPSHSYQYSFNPKPDWTSLYAPGAEILSYLQDTARTYGADRFIKLQHEVKSCTWDGAAGKWHVEVQPPDNAPVFMDSCDVLVSARGLLNTPQWPGIPGLETFKGKLMHSARWDPDFSLEGQNVGVIGSGSSAIQIVPQVQKVRDVQLKCFVRSKTWVSFPLAKAAQDRLGMSDDHTVFPKELVQKFLDDGDAWATFRGEVEADANSVHAITLKGSAMQVSAQKAFAEGMENRLKGRRDVFEFLKPGFAPGCRRLTPGPGFLEALVQDNVEFVKEGIVGVDESAVLTADGTRREVDVLVCATGFYASTAPPFPVVGEVGTTLKEHWAQRSYNYLSLATDGFPNLFFMLGPNGAIAEGSLTNMIESAGDYIVKAVRKMQKEGIKRMGVKRERVEDFTRYSDRYFEGTVFMDECKSWYRKDGQGRPSDKVTGVWPGSCLHCIETMRSPRWEDYEYDYGKGANALGFLGNGWSVYQLEEKPTKEQLAWYINPAYREQPLKGRPEEKEEYKARVWSH